MSEYNMTHTGKELDDAIAKVQSGYVFPNQSATVTKNGIYDTIGEIPVKLIAEIEVAVPVPDGYIIPSGTKNIVSNGTHDVTNYASAKVNVLDYEHFAYGYKTMTANASFEKTEIVDQQENAFTPKGYAFMLAPDISKNASYTNSSNSLICCLYDTVNGRMYRNIVHTPAYTIRSNPGVSSGSVGLGRFKQTASSNAVYNCMGLRYFWIAWG